MAQKRIITEVALWPPRKPRRAFKPRKPMKRSLSTLKRATGKIKPKAWKFKKTELSKCDSAFSKEIITRDGHCLYPRCFAEKNLTCSHYIGRANWNTRFDPANCITLCIRHHFMDRNTAYEFQKARLEKHGWNGQYTIFMRLFLGEKRWDELLTRAEGTKSRKEAIIETQKKYGLRQPQE